MKRLAALLACAVALPACGSNSGTPVSADDPLRGQERATLDVPLGQLTCSDWNGATVRDRTAVLEQLRANRLQAEEAGQGSVLEDDYAYRLLEDRCALPGSDAFVVYKLYAFAAGFAGTAP